MGCPGVFDVRLNCVCWPNMVTIIYTALSLQAYPCVLLVGGGICGTGFWGRWEQWAVRSDGWSRDGDNSSRFKLHKSLRGAAALGFLAGNPFYLWEHRILWLVQVS